ncbi:MAG: hypothetical protein R3F34_00330 [Planctomycetota bacterium]
MRPERLVARFLLALAFVAFAGAGRAHAEDPVVQLSLLKGWARAYTQDGVTWLTAASPALEVRSGVYVELGPDCTLELVDAGRFSATFRGSTSAELRFDGVGAPLLFLRRIERLETHTLRGSLRLEMPRGQKLEMRSCVFQARGLPDGRVWVEHLLGAPIELDLGGWYTFELGLGTRRYLPECLSDAPAVRRRESFTAVVPTRSPRPVPYELPTAPRTVDAEGVRRYGPYTEAVRRTALDTARWWNGRVERITSLRSEKP